MSWVGGDPVQLADAGNRLIAVPSQVSSGVTTPIDTLAGQVCTSARWTGAAADAFVQHWSQASLGAAAVGVLYETTGQVVYELADQLYATENALRLWAAEMAAEGALINADGSPGALPDGPSLNVEPTNEYAALRRDYLLLADGFRLEALRGMADLLEATQQMLTGPDVRPTVPPEDLVTYGGLLRGFGAVPAAALAYLERQTARARTEFAAATQTWRDAGGGRGGVPPGVKASRHAALTNRNNLLDRLNAARHSDLRISKLLNVSLRSVLTGLAPGLSTALDEAAKASRGVRFLRVLAGVPILEVVAGAAATYFMAQDDISKGESSGRAYVEAGAANAVGIGVGAGVAIGVTAVATSLGAAPVVAVAAGVVLGGAIAIGVGEFVYQAMDQDWGGLIEEHGVIGGIGEGLENTAEETGEALKDMWDGAWNWAFG